MSPVATLRNESPAHDHISNQLDYENQFVSFWLDGQLLGVPVNSVQEVLNPQTIAPTPLARPEIAGLLNLRGQIVTAVNLRKRMGLPDPDETREYMNVVFRNEGESFSLLVDEVGEVINISTDKMAPVPHTLDDHWKKVTAGVFTLEERLFIILNVDAILNFT